MKLLKSIFIFAIGACAGAAGAYYYAKDKFEKINEEEQEALLKHYGITRTEEQDDRRAKLEQNLNKPSITEYKRVIERTNYNTMSEKAKEVATEPEVTTEAKLTPPKLEVITLDDCGMEYEYEVVTIDLYEDGVFATDDDHEEVDGAKYFGDLDLDEIFEESEYGDCVYVRNHDLKLDIELAKESGTFTDLLARLYGED